MVTFFSTLAVSLVMPCAATGNWTLVMLVCSNELCVCVLSQSCILGWPLILNIFLCLKSFIFLCENTGIHQHAGFVLGSAIG